MRKNEISSLYKIDWFQEYVYGRPGIGETSSDTKGMENFWRRMTNDVENQLIVKNNKRFTTRGLSL